MFFKLLVFFFITFIAFSAKAQWYFGDGEAVNLTNGIKYDNGTKLIAGALDPSSTAVNAPPSSLYFSTSGTVYVKQDSGSSTNWLPVGVAAPSSLSTINGQSGPAVVIATGSSGTDFNIGAAANTVTLNLPTASASNRGLLSTTDWSDFDGKQDAITGAASTITSSNLTANRAVISNGSGKITVSVTTDTELGYVSGVTSAIQTQIDSKEPSITVLPISKGGTNSSSSLNNNRIMQSSSGAITEAPVITSSRALVSDTNGIPTHSAVTSAELAHVSGVTSSIQTQINSKQATITGAASSIVSSDLTINRALVSDASGKVANSSVTSTELGYVSGVTSAIQTQIDSKVTGPAASVDSEVMIYNGTTGKLAKRASGTGFAKLTSGVLSTSSSVNLTSDVSDVLPVANGGTGRSTMTANNVILGNGTSAVQLVAPGSTGNILRSDGSTWVSDGLSGSNVQTVPGVSNPVMYLATINCDAASAIIGQTGAWITSINNISGGSCVLAIPVGKFSSSSYYCTLGPISFGGATNNQATLQVIAKATTSLTFRCRANSGGTNVDCTEFTTDIACFGTP
jgi:hypothetical protein